MPLVTVWSTLSIFLAKMIMLGGLVALMAWYWYLWRNRMFRRLLILSAVLALCLVAGINPWT